MDVQPLLFILILLLEFTQMVLQLYYMGA